MPISSWESYPRALRLEFSNPQSLSDQEFSFLTELIGDEKCQAIEEIDLKVCGKISVVTLDLIVEKMKNLKRINLRGTPFERYEIDSFSKKMQCEINSGFGLIPARKK
jgi:hypothetical protein